jgi:hypothetical protein
MRVNRSIVRCDHLFLLPLVWRSLSRWIDIVCVKNVSTDCFAGIEETRRRQDTNSQGDNHHLHLMRTIRYIYILTSYVTAGWVFKAKSSVLLFSYFSYRMVVIKLECTRTLDICDSSIQACHIKTKKKSSHRSFITNTRLWLLNFGVVVVIFLCIMMIYWFSTHVCPSFGQHTPPKKWDAPPRRVNII